jgi:hypothetical protein
MEVFLTRGGKRFELALYDENKHKDQVIEIFRQNLSEEV